MSVINLVTTASLGNLGTPFASFNPGIVRSGILIPRGTFLTATQLQTPQASIQANLTANSRQNRSFMLPKLGVPKDNSEDPKTQDLDGWKPTTWEGNWDCTYQIIKGTQCMQQQLLNFKYCQDIFDIIIIDDQNCIWGTAATDITGQLAFGGFNLFEFFVYNKKQRTVSATNEYRIRIHLDDVKQMNDYFVWAALGFNALTKLQGPIDVALTNITASGAPSHQYTISVTAGCGATNLATKYGTTLAVPGAWVITDTTSSTSVTPSSVALNGAGNAYVITLPGTGPTAGDNISMNLANISTLAGTPYNIQYIASETAINVTY